MSTLNVQERIWKTFGIRKAPLRKSFLRSLARNQQSSPVSMAYFSPFNQNHLDAAMVEFKAYSEAYTHAGELEMGVIAVLGLADNKLSSLTQNPDLTFYALELFLNSLGDRLDFKLPSIFIREPEFGPPSSIAALEPDFEVADGSEDETKMDWFREDPLLNEHHGHWHMVYPSRIAKDRQGEMFFSMHRQMLARYRADRLALEVPDIIPYDDFTRPIAVGYLFGDDIRLSNAFRAARPVGSSTRTDQARNQLRQLQLIKKAIASGQWDPSHPTDMDAEIKMIDTLGGTIEPNPAGIPTPYNGYHATGHVYIAEINDGVMGLTSTAIRDVVFWEWHQGIDDIYQSLIDRLQPHHQFTDAPNIRIRKSFTNNRPDSPDIIICRTADIEGYTIETGEMVGEQAFGGERWDQAFAQWEGTYKDHFGNDRNIKTTSMLQTDRHRATMEYVTDAGELKRYHYDYINHDPFCYFIRVSNPALEQQLITVRIFIVPEEWAEDHRHWIEMDKFSTQLPPQSKHVIFRADEQSSVVQKPVVRPPDHFERVFDPVDMRIDERRCKCGWPYHMLLPIGSPKGDGSTFMLLVMITHNDLIGAERNCGSLSFCGLADDRYPDKRPQGYPFNRKFLGTDNPITEAIQVNHHMAARTIVIKHIM